MTEGRKPGLWLKIKETFFMPVYGAFGRGDDGVRPEDWDQVDWVKMDARHGRKRMEKMLPYLPEGGLHLDVGTGAGHGSILAAAKTRLVGVDYGIESTRLARAKGLRVAQADARSLPFPDDLFDSVTFLDVLEHIPEAARAVAELGRVTKPGGRVIVATPTDDLLSERVADWARGRGLLGRMQPFDQPYDRAQVEAMIRAAGLEIHEARVISNWVPNPVLRLITRTRLYICQKPRRQG